MMWKVCIGVIVLLVASASTVRSADETLVGWWAFEEGKGDVVKDLSGSENDGTIMGDVKWQPGKVGIALALHKDGKGYVEITDNETLDISEQITISAWIKPTKIYIGGDWRERNCIIAKRRAYYLDISEKGKLASYLYNVQPQQWLEGEVDLTDFLNTWVHVATVYDGKEHKLYVNGKLDVSAKKSGTITVNNDNLTIGWVDNNRYFDGLIDEVKIWSRGLTEEELELLLPVRPKGKLATYWGAIKSGRR